MSYGYGYGYPVAALTRGGGGVLALEEMFASGVTTRIVGNSLASQNKWANDRFSVRGDVHYGSAFARGMLRFKPSAITTYMDKYGIYGHGGTKLRTMLDELAVQFIAPTNAAGITPELIGGHSLQENDLAAGDVTIATLRAELDEFLALIQATWPTTKIWLIEPRPSFSYDKPQKIETLMALRVYYRGKDNGQTIFTSRSDVYEDPSHPGWPLAGYTDSTVHFNSRGSLALGRSYRGTLERIALSFANRTSRAATPFLGGSNRFLAGSAAASGLGVTGARPTGHTINAAVTGGHTSSEALDPGWKLTAGMDTPTAGGQPFQSAQFAAIPLASPPFVAPYVRVKIGSGAERLQRVVLNPRLQDGGGNTFRPFFVVEGGDVDPDFLEGDDLSFIAPPLAPNSGVFSNYIGYFQPFTKNLAGDFALTITDQGIFLPL